MKFSDNWIDKKLSINQPKYKESDKPVNINGLMVLIFFYLIAFFISNLNFVRFFLLCHFSLKI